MGGTTQGVKCLHAHLAWWLTGADDPVGEWTARQIGLHPGLSGAPEEDLRSGRRPHGCRIRRGSKGAWTQSDPVAAIDCGTNSTRLLVVDAGGQPTRAPDADHPAGRGGGRHRPAGSPRPSSGASSVLTRVPGGDGQVRRWSGDAWWPPRRLGTPPTETSSSPRPARRPGCEPELLEGTEEGRLSMAGAVSDLDPGEGPFLVLDIGGGSTELVTGSGPDDPDLAVVSLQVGCVRITERFLTSTRPRRPSWARPSRWSNELLDAGHRRPAPLPGRPPPGRSGRHRHHAGLPAAWGSTTTTATGSTTRC